MCKELSLNLTANVNGGISVDARLYKVMMSEIGQVTECRITLTDKKKVTNQFKYLDTIVEKDDMVSLGRLRKLNK